MRKPAVAGQFYSRNAEGLREELDNCFAGTKGQGLPQLPAVGAVVPHAGYTYSGHVAAHVYARLPKAETFIIIGPNHRGIGSAVSVSSETWSTPLGSVEADREFIEKLPKKIIDTDEDAHRQEHSLEVQVPFLQYAFKSFRIVPIVMSLQDDETAKEVGEEIAKAMSETKRNAIIIASSDFTHYEPDSAARQTDRQVIEAILEMDVEKMYRRIFEKDASVCGYGPIAAMLNATKKVASGGELLEYATSGDVVGDKSSVVGYAGIIIKRK
jgi:hypothetical protein